MTQRTLFIADTHFNHKRIHDKFRPQFNSDEEHDTYIHNNIIEAADTNTSLWILGDSFFSPKGFWRLEEFRKAYQQVNIVLGNHCLSQDTEVLTSDGWKFSTDISREDMVASVCLKNKTLSFNLPRHVETHPPKEMFEVKGTYVNELVTTGHSCIVDGKRVEVDSIPNKVMADRFLFGGNIETCHKWTENEVSLIAWVVCDATIVNRSERNKRIQFKLSKQRKIDELEKLLKNCGLEYTKRLANKSNLNILQPYYICLYGDSARYVFNLLDGKKQYPKSLIGIRGEVFNSFMKTLSITDGYMQGNTIEMVTVEKEQADTLQMICVANNIPCRVLNKGIKASGFANGRPQYAVRINLSLSNTKSYVTVNKMGVKLASVGIETVDGTLVTRREGRVVVTGNCHSTLPRYALQFKNVNVFGVQQRYGLWLSHIPVMQQEMYRAQGCVAGHLHSKHVLDENGEIDNRYYIVSCEQVGYRPISLAQIKEERGWK